MTLWRTLSIAMVVLSSTTVFAETQLSVKAAAEYRNFFQNPLNVQQTDNQLSLFVEPEIYYSWNDNLDSITFKAFYRWDNEDDERTHADIRELMWLHVGDDWELRTGIGSVFWGQTESAHLVDVINQTDGVEAIDGEDKLGQPMLNLTLIRDWGNVDLFILPGFRDRTFPGENGRLRPLLTIDTDNPIYQSSDEDNHIDFAARWSHSIDVWELGVSYFKGTSREAAFEATIINEEIVLQPYYQQISQIGVDLLAVLDSWIYKFEGIYRDTNEADNYFALITGFEYTLVGVFDSVYDIGWLMEYQFDERGKDSLSNGQNDLLFGARWVLNDVDGTEMLIGIIQDLDYSNSQSAFVEASSRIDDNWKWRLDARFFNSSNILDITYNIRKDDHVEFSLEYYF